MGSMADDSREVDRRAALAARRTALRGLPIIAAVWVVVVVVLADVEWVLRVGTLVAVAVSVVLGARAAVTARTFVRRWLDDDARRPPPMWVTLLAVAGAVATLVALANVAADISADRPAVLPIVLATVFLGVTVATALAHVTGGRGVAAALAAPSDRAVPVEVHGRSSASADEGAASVGPATVQGVVRTAPESASPQLAALRLLLQEFVRLDAGEPAATARDAVGLFRRIQSAEVVMAARAQLDTVRSRGLDELAAGQVVTLLGCRYDPTEHGGTYRGWLAALASAFAEDD